MTKHFFKTLAIFMLMIIFGLAGVALVGYFNEKELNSATPVDKVVK